METVTVDGKLIPLKNERLRYPSLGTIVPVLCRGAHTHTRARAHNTRTAHTTQHTHTRTHTSVCTLIPLKNGLLRCPRRANAAALRSAVSCACVRARSGACLPQPVHRCARLRYRESGAWKAPMLRCWLVCSSGFWSPVRESLIKANELQDGLGKADSADKKSALYDQAICPPAPHPAAPLD